MDWNALGAIGEIVGAVAVVATLGYLAVQIRSAHRASTDSNRQQRAAAVRDSTMAAVRDPELREAWTKALKLEEVYKPIADELEITPDQAHTLDLYIMNWVYVHWPQHHSALTNYDRKELDTLLGNFYSIPPIPEFLARTPYRGAVDEEFLKYIEDLIAKQKNRDDRDHPA